MKKLPTFGCALQAEIPSQAVGGLHFGLRKPLVAKSITEVRDKREFLRSCKPVGARSAREQNWGQKIGSLLEFFEH